MKLTSIIFLAGVLALSGTKLQAQDLDDQRVKILPTDNKDIIKVLYALETNEPVKVKFLTKEGVVGSDKIKGEFPIGLSKRYDVGEINDQEFWVEISTPLLSMTYRIEPSKDKKNFTPHLEKISQTQVFVVNK